MTRIKVCDVGGIDDGTAVRIGASTTGTGAAIAVFHDGGGYYALDDVCTHAEASLSDGWIEDGEVECPMHSGRFCLRTGEARSMPATVDAVTHRVEVSDGAVWLYTGQPAVRP